MALYRTHMLTEAAAPVQLLMSFAPSFAICRGSGRRDSISTAPSGHTIPGFTTSTSRSTTRRPLRSRSTSMTGLLSLHRSAGLLLPRQRPRFSSSTRGRICRGTFTWSRSTSRRTSLSSPTKTRSSIKKTQRSKTFAFTRGSTGTFTSCGVTTAIRGRLPSWRDTTASTDRRCRTCRSAKVRRSRSSYTTRTWKRRSSSFES